MHVNRRLRILALVCIVTVALSGAAIGPALAQEEDASDTEDFGGTVGDATNRNNVTLEDGELTLNETYTPYDVAAFAQTDSRDLSPELGGLTHGIHWRSDGQMLFVIETNGNVSSFDAADAWNLSTISRNQTIDLSTVTPSLSNPTDLKLNETGDRLVISDTDATGGSNNDDKLVSYNLTSAWDVTSAQEWNTLNVSSEHDHVNGFDLNNPGTVAYVTGQDSDNITQHTSSGSAGWGDLSAINEAPLNRVDVSAQDAGPQDVTWSADGEWLFMAGADNEEIFRYETAGTFSLSGATLNGSLDVAVNAHQNPTEDITSLAWDPLGTRLYTITDQVWVYEWQEASVASQHTTNTDFNNADTLDNVTVSGGSVSLSDEIQEGTSRWPFDDDTDASTATDVWDANDGTINGATFTSDAIDGNALDFDNTTQDNVTTGTEIIGTTSDSVTLSLWANLDNFGGYQAGEWAGSSSDDSMRIDTNTGEWRVFIRESDGDGVSVTATGSQTGTWQHVVAVANTTASELELFVNGTSVGTEPWDGTFAGGGQFTIGSSHDGQEYTDGKLDDVRVYERALSSSDVQRLYDDEGVDRKKDSGTYISQNHSVTDPASGQTNLTLVNASAVVTWEYFDGNTGTWKTDRKRTYSTTGNRSVELTKSADTWRVNVTFVNETGPTTARLDDEAVIQLDRGQLFASAGYWERQYPTTEAVLHAKLNWTHTVQGGSITYWLRTGDSGSYTEVTGAEDVWQDFTASNDQNLWVRVNISYDGTSEVRPSVDQYVAAWDLADPSNATLTLSIQERFEREETASYSVTLTFENGTQKDVTGDASTTSNDTTVLAIDRPNGTAIAQDKAGYVLVNSSYTVDGSVVTDNATTVVFSDELRDFQFIDGSVTAALLVTNWGWITLLAITLLSSGVFFATRSQTMCIMSFTALVVLAWLLGMQELETAIVSVASGGVLVLSDV